ncbi:MAG: molybdopterin-dependent oxidoreductase [Gammaproteobacteria bacterium]|jgi:anaerobic selenocysteine-containing dehydrogenase|nr:molybdopterin-dependent oxidoreductase [Gammaproteobacteria bacterium]
MPRIATTCPHDCPSTCALQVERIDSKTIGGVYAAKHNTYTQGVLCAKVARYADRVHHPDRITSPLLRVGPKGVGMEAFKPIAWDMALDILSDRFAAIAKDYGPQAIWPYYYAGTMGLVQRDSINRLTHALGYSRQKSTICIALADAGYLAATGAKRGVDPREIEHSKLIVVWGGNPVHTQINFMHHVTKAKLNNAAKLVVIDPYVTATAKKADLHLMLRPGTDGALATAVMHYLFANNLVNWDYLQQYTDDPYGLAEHVKSRDLSWAAAITGLSTTQIAEFAELYGTNPQAYLRLGYGFTRSRNGAFNMHAAACLPALTGAWQHLGGGALYSNSGLYDVDTSHIQGTSLIQPEARILDQSRIGPILTGSDYDLQGQGPIKAMLIQSTNPMVVAPETRLVQAGLARADLWLCVHEHFMTETAAMADLVLPATMFVEHDDIYLSSGHTHIQLGRKVIDGPELCRSNSWLINQLGQRLGATSQAFFQSDMELVQDLVERSALDWQTLSTDNWLDCAQPFEQAHYLDGFAHPDGKFHLRHGWQQIPRSKAILSPFPDHVPITDTIAGERRWRLVTAPARHYLNSSFNESAISQKLEKQPHLLVHKDDLKQLGLKDGAEVTIGNRHGEVCLPVKATRGLLPGTLVCESLWPNKAFKQGMGINLLTSAHEAFPNGGAVFHDTSVWLKPV